MDTLQTGFTPKQSIDNTINTNTICHMPTLTAKAIIEGFPARYRPEIAPPNYQTCIHFDILGGEGGRFTVVVNDGVCVVSEGHTGEAACMVIAKDTDYADVALGRINAQMAVMMGKINISNLSTMMIFVGLFHRLY